MINMYNAIYKFFDKLEDKIRIKLTHYPIIYAFIGCVGIISIWRGVWVISDNWDISGFASLFLGILLTLATGLFISFFIGDNIIISGINKEKRVDEKTEEEIHKERTTISKIEKDIKEIKNILEENKK